MRKHTNKSKKAKQPVTITSLAHELGISRQAVARHAKKPGAPELADVNGWQEFLAAHGREGTAPPELRRKIAVQRLRLLKAMATRAEYSSARERGELISRGDVQFALARGTALLFSGLDRLANVEWPATLKGKEEREICGKVTADVEKLKEDFRAALQKLASEPTPQKEA
jgi:phage terminase Nu1 subunit (DNA packaging protein)